MANDSLEKIARMYYTELYEKGISYIKDSERFLVENEKIIRLTFDRNADLSLNEISKLKRTIDIKILTKDLELAFYSFYSLSKKYCAGRKTINYDTNDESKRSTAPPIDGKRTIIPILPDTGGEWALSEFSALEPYVRNILENPKGYISIFIKDSRNLKIIELATPRTKEEEGFITIRHPMIKGYEEDITNCLNYLDNLFNEYHNAR